MTYVMGTDMGSPGGDKAAVVIIEVRHGAMFVVGKGQHDDMAMATAMAVSMMLAGMPWWKRTWRRAVWAVRRWWATR